MSKRKLTDKQVKAIWELFAKRVESPTEIRKRLNLPVSHSVVRRILEGQTYKHLKPGPEELTTGDFLLALFGRGWVTVGMLRASPVFRYRHASELQEFGIRLWKQNLVNQMSLEREKSPCWKISPKGVKYLRSGLGNLTKDLQTKVDVEQEKIAIAARQTADDIETMAKAIVRNLMSEILPELYTSTWPAHINDFVNKANKRLQALNLPARLVFEPKDRGNPLQFVFLDKGKGLLSPLERQIANFVVEGGEKSHWRTISPPAQRASGAKCSDVAIDDIQEVAERLGGEVRGEVKATGGYFGVLDLAEEVARRFKVPAGGGRATDPEWTEKRLINLLPGMLENLGRLSESLGISPMQLGALLLEKTVNEIVYRSAVREWADSTPKQQVGGLKCSDIVVNDIQEFAGVELLPPAVTVKMDADYLGGRIAPPMYVLFSCVDELDVVTFGTYGVPRVWEAIGLKTLVGNIYKVCNMGQKFDGLYEVLEATPMKNGVKLKMRRVKNENSNVPR